MIISFHCLFSTWMSTYFWIYHDSRKPKQPLDPIRHLKKLHLTACTGKDNSRNGLWTWNSDKPLHFLPEWTSGMFDEPTSDFGQVLCGYVEQSFTSGKSSDEPWCYVTTNFGPDLNQNMYQITRENRLLIYISMPLLFGSFPLPRTICSFSC